MSQERANAANILHLALKELKSLWSDKVLLGLIVWAFTAAIYSSAKGVSQELYNAAVAIVDEDQSPLSRRLAAALVAPRFKAPQAMGLADMDRALDQGRISFGIIIPARFQQDLAAGRHPTIQVNIDATIMSQSFIGAGYIRSIFTGEINEYLTGRREDTAEPVSIALRARFNPNLQGYWFGGVMELINQINLLTIILVGAAVLREKEHGTLEHLLAMPLTPFQIMASKILANGLAVLAGSVVALLVVIEGILGVPVAGSVPLFLGGTALYLFSAASLGIFLSTLARSMPQFGLLVILTVVPLELLSGGVTPRESMPEIIQNIMLATPTPYFVRVAQATLYRGAGLATVWSDLVAITALGALYFAAAQLRFRRSVTLG